MWNDSDPTKELLELAGAGDLEAFNRLFARHRSTLRTFVSHRFDNRLQARIDPSDVVQETQIEAFRRFSDYFARRPMPFALWLQKTAYERLCNLHRDHVRTQRRSMEREQRMPDHSSVLIAHSLRREALAPIDVMAQQETQRRLAELIARLPDLDREVLLMRNVDGLSHSDIAMLLEIEPATARKRYARALVKLEQLLLDEGLTGTEP